MAFNIQDMMFAAWLVLSLRSNGMCRRVVCNMATNITDEHFTTML
jgi:hypothetical protein